MLSTARLLEPQLSGLAGIVQSSSQSSKPGRASWLDNTKVDLNKPNPAIATQPQNDTVRKDYLKDDLT